MIRKALALTLFVVSALSAKTIYDYTMNSIDGTPSPLSNYKGKVVMIVNVASKCGFTPQYAGLESLYKKYKDQGFVILGFPANNFMSQEPGTNSEIKQFCSRTYGVDFPMFAKSDVKGPETNPLYQYLTAEKGGEIKWNFTKFLVGRDGQIVGRFEPKVTPDAPEVTSAIEQALKQ
jgi:glutathione peroxidase